MATFKKMLTVRSVEAFKPAAKGERDDHWDTLCPSFMLRVTDTGAATPVVKRRIGKTGNPATRVVGPSWTVPIPKKSECLPFDLTALRKAAHEVAAEMRAGVDPNAKRVAAAKDAERRADSVFGAV